MRPSFGCIIRTDFRRAGRWTRSRFASRVREIFLAHLELLQPFVETLRSWRPFIRSPTFTSTCWRRGTREARTSCLRASRRLGFMRGRCRFGPRYRRWKPTTADETEDRHSKPVCNVSSRGVGRCRPSSKRDDDGLYVLKFKGAGQGTKALIAELVAGEVGRLAGLPVPEIVFIDLPADLATDRARRGKSKGLIRGSGGLNLALDYLPGSVTFRPLLSYSPDPASCIRDRVVRRPSSAMWIARYAIRTC